MFEVKRGFGEFFVVNAATGEKIRGYSGKGSKAKAEAQVADINASAAAIDKSMEGGAAMPRRRVHGRIV